MARYLLDTNIFLRGVDENSHKQAVVRDAIRILLEGGHTCYICSQVLSEFWVVATRPVSENGLGWRNEQIEAEVKRLLQTFPVAIETSEAIRRWLDLMITHQVRGKRAHDIKLLGIMQANGISHLVTLNPRDFPAIEGITIVDPAHLLE